MTHDQPESRRRDDDATAGLAQDLYEQVRQLNHATAGAPGLTRPSTAYTILGNLSASAYGLDQTFVQLGRFLRRELDGGRLGHDRGHHPAQAVQDACDALSEARDITTRLARSLGNAQSAINAVHGPVHPAAALAGDDFPLSVSEAVKAGPADDRSGPSPSPSTKTARSARKGI
ncbi:hypothetical protein SAMN04489712_10642 [Thermomonospora echinospora]|uniref:Uncharacterized protein n=1 Tax=Thermomonospora echinospora TaxID=1992 RepID=A0A1H6AWI7_9ACTN|nr:hypothetical protein [Thermomonospora echinospora]SEG52610.1 hypothetical protein SAMN04489712_10642 [Thermomonospora echinospora]